MQKIMRVHYKKLAKLIGFAGLAVLPGMGAFGQNTTPKNIIMVIGDGMSAACVQATDYFQGKTQAYEAFPVTTWQSSYNAKNPKNGFEVEHFALEYRSDSVWTNFGWAARDGRTGRIAGYTDSAPAATALSTGKKAADGVLNIDVDGNQLVTIAEHALKMGKKAGVVSTVQFTHATPAGYIAHNMDRNASALIAQEMLASKLSVIIGTGHPDYNENAQYAAGVQGYNYVGGQNVWNDLLTGGITNPGGIVNVADIDGNGTADAWSLVQDSLDFARIGRGENVPSRLLGIPRAGATLQAYREGRNDERAKTAFATPLNTGVPSLAEMSMAAINVLNNDNENGFFVMIEGGAIDWSNHDNNAGRMIEEMTDLNKAIDAVIAWIEANGGWENNLLIYTSDHECGYFIGPDHRNQTVNNPVDNPIVDNGAGNMPGYSYHSPSHTNMLVPVYAKGAGAGLLKTHESRTDFYRGKYIDNSDIANTLFTLWTPQEEVKNFILMISDGMGHNTVKANNLWENKNKQVYENFPVISAMSTYHGRAGNYQATDDISLYRTGYNSTLAWTDPEYINEDYTDSAPAATAMATGTKIYDGAINVDLDDSPLLNTLPQVATKKGKSAGVVSSVQISHATPAGLGGAHNANRNANAAISQELFFDTHLSVAIGTGHPLYNDQGVLRTAPEHTWIGADAWNALTSGSTTSGANTAKDINGDGTPDAWTLIQDSADFAQIAKGERVPLRLAGVPKVYQTLQQRRTDAATGKASAPFTIPFNRNIPALSDLSLAALNVLNQNQNGFFVMIEGGAIDWANHDNNLPFAIEEQYNFNRAVEAVINWVETNSSWDETLLIVTSDHECGYLTGPNGQNINPFTNPIIANGANTPEHAYYSPSHTNTLVPIYAKGAGAEKLNSYRNMYDYVYGYYLDNTNIPHFVLKNWNKLADATPNIRYSPSSTQHINDDETNNTLNVYPTLVDDFVTIECAAGNTVEIYNLNGQFAFGQKLTAGISMVNLSALPKGLYIVKAAGKQSKIVKK